eukprot:gene13165-17638_t
MIFASCLTFVVPLLLSLSNSNSSKQTKQPTFKPSLRPKSNPTSKPSLNPTVKSTKAVPSSKPSTFTTIPPTSSPSNSISPTIESTTSQTNSISPTIESTFSPTIESTLPDLCCQLDSYELYQQWSYCANAADGGITSCAQCSSYQCIDWTVGSNAMQQREASYKSRTNDNVYFAVGSYGNDQTRAGLCYRLTTADISKDIIFQVINQGGDVLGDNFDIQTGAGGFGVHNACAGTSMNPQFGGSINDWGDTYGGVTYKGGCSKLPAYPLCAVNPSDSMQDLCVWSFNNNFRKNTKILKVCDVACPSELYQATGLHRADETNNGFTCDTSTSVRYNTGSTTRMMDCAKPSYGWIDNVKGLTDPAYPVVIPCRRDGYTRVHI